MAIVTPRGVQVHPPPQLLSAIPIASAASTVLARAGLRNLYNAKILLGIAEQSDFWGAS